jgi:glycosyltransferase involved in cell wall biosynthesis
MQGSAGRPSVSVVVPTRNRPDHALACVKELLRCDGFLEIIVVDQSDGDATEVALASLADSRARCVRSHLRGATNGRNVGIDLSRGEVIAFTDDDCRVALDWVTRIADIFQNDPDAAVVCGRVYVPEELAKDGFAIGFEPEVREWWHRFPPPDRDWGITANLSARRAVFERLGKFDPLLGPGAPLRCGEEPDLLFRVLKAGMKVLNAREVQVAHLGVRGHGSESSELWNTYGVGTSAALFKHVRLGDLDAAKLYLQHLGIMGRLVTKNLLTGNRPTGLRYTWAFLSGALASMKFRVDGAQRLYVEPEVPRS